MFTFRLASALHNFDSVPGLFSSWMFSPLTVGIVSPPEDFVRNAWVRSCGARGTTSYAASDGDCNTNSTLIVGMSISDNGRLSFQRPLEVNHVTSSEVPENLCLGRK